MALADTRSSHLWRELPGNFDRLNTRALYPSSNQWGIPDLPAATFEPSRLVAYNDRTACDDTAPLTDRERDLLAAVESDTTVAQIAEKLVLSDANAALQLARAKRKAAFRAAGDVLPAVHFFLDDYRFEVAWSKPERPLSRLRRVGAALTPDFSLWRDMPPAMQVWQTYRNRWCGMWMLEHGIAVVPTVSWSTEASYPFAFAGIAPGSVVAVSTVGVRARDARALFAQGYTAMCETINPTLVLVYGHALDELADSPVRYYPTRWKEQKATMTMTAAQVGE